MTYRLPENSVSHLPLPSKRLTYKPLKLYSLYKLNGNRWIKDSPNSYSERSAYVVFGKRLSENPLVFKIKPISQDSV